MKIRKGYKIVAKFLGIPIKYADEQNDKAIYDRVTNEDINARTPIKINEDMFTSFA